MLAVEEAGEVRPMLDRLRIAQLTRWLLGDDHRARIWTASFWIALVTLCTLRAALGLYGTRIYSHDAFMVLDGAWRMMHGQRPHLDFNSMIGPMAYLPCLVGLYLSGGTVAGFGYGLALAGLAVGAWAYFLTRRFVPVLRFGYAMLAAAVTFAPAMVGPSPFNLSPGMTYNRLSYALLALLLVECLLPSGRWKFWEGFSTGTVLALLLFTKMTGVAVGVLLVIGFSIINKKPGLRWLGLFSGFAVCALPFFAYLRFQFGPMLKDLAITAAAKHIAYTERYDFNAIAFEAIMTLAVVIPVATWLASQQQSREAKRVLWAAVITLTTSVLLVFGNFQRSELPLATFFLLWVLNVCAPALSTRKSDALLQVSVLGGVLYVGSAILALAMCFGVAVYARVYTVRYTPLFDAAALRAFVPVGFDYHYVPYVNEGLHLLEANRRPGERVMALDFVNPYSIGLQIPPASGGSTNLQYGGSFNDQHKVPAEDLFGRADLVMYPVHEDDTNLGLGMELNYRPYLQRHFALVATSPEWNLYRRIS